MNFAKSFNDITVDENTYRKTRIGYIDTYKNVCIGTIDRLKYILTIIKNREIYNWITKEVLIALYVTTAVSLKIGEAALEVLFVKMIELKNKAIKFKGNWKSCRIGEYYEPVIQEMLDRNNDKRTRYMINEEVKDFATRILATDGNKINRKERLDIFLEEFLKMKETYDGKFNRTIKERPESRKFYYELENRNEIELSYRWKENTERMKKQAKELNKKTKMEPIYINVTTEEERRLQFNRESKAIVLEVYLLKEEISDGFKGKIGKWVLKPKNYIRQRFKKKKDFKIEVMEKEEKVIMQSGDFIMFKIEEGRKEKTFLKGLNRRGRRSENGLNIYVIITRKEKINRFGKPFEEKKNTRREQLIQSTNTNENTFNSTAQEKIMQVKTKINSLLEETYANIQRFTKGKKVVQDQTKIMAKAHSGSHKFALCYVITQKNINNTLSEESLHAIPIKSAEKKETIEAKGNELHEDKEENDLYYIDKGNELAENQTETMAKPHSGFQDIVLSSIEGRETKDGTIIFKSES
jgi:hypothetical protein